VHCSLQLVVVINVLGNPINCCLKGLNGTIVTSDLKSVNVISKVKFSLFVFECINDATKSSVNSIVTLHLIVKLSSCNLQIHDFLLFWTALNLQFLNLVVEYVFEFV
jgi:hypothetical protein